MAGYLRLELLRIVRDGRYLVLALAAPIGFYLLFAGIFGTAPAGTTGGLPASVEIMVAMATFGAMWGALSATAPRLAADRETGWLRALQLTPLRPASVLAARILAALIVALPGIVAVGATAALAHDVRLAAWQWSSGLALLWIGTLPFVALGIVIGSMMGSTTAYALTTGLYFALSALGGLWIPPPVLSPALRRIAGALPSYQLADLGWHIASGTAPPLRGALILLGWTVALSGLALLVTRRRAGPAGAPAAPGDDAVVLQDLQKHYGAVTAADGISLRIPAGGTIALLGPNGAGKTTTINLMLGLITPDHGAAYLSGSPPAHAVSEGQVGAMLQDSGLMTGVRVGELVQVIRRLYPAPVPLPELIQTAGIADVLHRRADQLSGGQSQRVRFALAAAGNPPLLVLDEPTAAMDVQAREAFWATIARYTRQHKTVLFSTHYLEEAEAHADRVVMLRAGRVAADGTADQITSAADIERVIRFRLLTGPSGRFAALPAVTAVRADGNRVTLHTSNADVTLWALCAERDNITGIEVTRGHLQEAFLALTASDPARGQR